MKKGKVLDLFAGIGSMTLAAERADLNVVCAIGDSVGEAEIYQKNFGEKVYLCTTSDRSVFSRLSNIDYVCGMLPVFFSVSGGKKQEEMQSWEYVREVLDKIAPKGFVFVLCGAQMKNWSLVEEYLALEKYHVHMRVLDSQKITGMPVHDKNCYLVGIRKDLNDNFEFPDSIADYQYDINDLLVDEEGTEMYLLSSHIKEKIQFEPGAKIYNFNYKSIANRDNEFYYVPDSSINYNTQHPSILLTESEVRRISIRELARTKFFPDEFSFEKVGITFIRDALRRSANVNVAAEIMRRVSQQMAEDAPKIHGEKLCPKIQNVLAEKQSCGEKQHHAEQRQSEPHQMEQPKEDRSAGKECRKKNTEAVQIKQVEEKKKRIFLSYCQKDSDIADLIEEKLTPYIQQNYGISRDVRDVAYKESFRKFMESIQEHEFVIMILSDHYMKSLNCMFEMLEVFKDSNYGKKLLFFVLSEEDGKYYKTPNAGNIAADIYSTDGQTKYILYWKEELRKVDMQIQQIGEPMYAMMQINNKSRIVKIQLELQEFFKYIADARGLALKEHISSEFREIRRCLASECMRKSIKL